jgi:hypothetical protein
MAKTTGGGPSADQLKIAQQLSTVISMMATQTEKMAKGFENQAEAAAQMAKNMESMGTGEVVNQLAQINETLKQVVQSLENLNKTSASTFEAMQQGAAAATTGTQQLSEAVTEAGKAASDSDSAFSRLESRLGKTGKGAKDLKGKLDAIGDYLQDKHPVAVGAALGALSGLAQGFKNLMAMGSGVMDFLGGLVGSLFEVGKAIISIPIKIFEGLMEKANSAGGGISELAEAINNMRKEFGALSGPTNTAIMGISKDLGNLQLSGVSAMQVFGNMADRVKAVTELFVQGGPGIRQFSQEILDGGGAVLALQKGLGITNEQMGKLGSLAKSKGMTITKTLTDITKYADNLGKRFGLDSKLISKSMAEMSTDLAHFGHMSVKEIGRAAAYFQKLGVEVKDVTGMMDKTMTFEDAAEAVSQMNSALGTNVDLNEVMQAGADPTKLFALYSKALQDTGKDLTKLDARERAFLKQQTGMTDEMLNAAIAHKDAADMQKEMTKEADKAEKKVMTTEEAISKLSDAMERLLKSGGGDGPKGFWDAFTSGIEKGIMSSQEFMGLMKNLRLSTMEFTKAGFSLGKTLVEMFPGIKDILGGLKDLFDPGRIGKFIRGATADIAGFFKDLTEGKMSFPQLMDKLKEKFFDFFDKSGPAGQKLMKGFEKFFKAIRDIFAQAIKWVMTKVGEFVKDIVDFIKNPSGPDVSGLKDGATSFLAPIADAFREGWKVLGPALKDLFEVVMQKLADIVLPMIKKFAADNWGKIALVLFGPAFAQALVGALIPALGGALVKSVGGLLSGGGGGLIDAVKGVVGKIASAVGGGPSAGTGKAVGATMETLGAATSPAGLNPANTANAQTVGEMIDAKTIIKFLLAIAAIITMGLASFYAAAKIVEGMSMETVVKAMMVLGTIAVETGILGGELYLLSKVPTPDLGIVKTLVAIGTVMLALAGLGYVVTKIASGLNITDIIKGVLLVGGMATLSAGISLLIPELMALGAALTGPQAAAAAIGLAAVAVAIIALAGLGYLMVKMLGSLSKEEMVKAALAYAAVAAVVAGIVVSLLAVMAAGLAAIVGATFLGPGFLVVAGALVGMKPIAEALVARAPDDPEALKKAGEAYAAVGMTVVGIAKALLLVAAAGLAGLVGAQFMGAGMLVVAAAIVGMQPVAEALVSRAPSDPEGLKKAGEAYAAVGMAVVGIAKSLLTVMGLGFASLVGATFLGPGLAVVAAAVIAMQPIAEQLVKRSPGNPEALKKAGEAYAAVGEAVLGIAKTLLDVMKLGFATLLGATFLGPGMAVVAAAIVGMKPVAEALVDRAPSNPEALKKAGEAYASVAEAVKGIQPVLIEVAKIGFGALLGSSVIVPGFAAIALIIPAIYGVAKEIEKFSINATSMVAMAIAYVVLTEAIGKIRDAIIEITKVGFTAILGAVTGGLGAGLIALAGVIPSLAGIAKAMNDNPIGDPAGIVTTGMAYAAISYALAEVSDGLLQVSKIGIQQMIPFLKTSESDFKAVKDAIKPLAEIGQAMVDASFSAPTTLVLDAAMSFAAIAVSLAEMTKTMGDISSFSLKQSLPFFRTSPSDFQAVKDALKPLKEIGEAMVQNLIAAPPPLIKNAAESFAAISTALAEISKALGKIGSMTGIFSSMPSADDMTKVKDLIKPLSDMGLAMVTSPAGLMPASTMKNASDFYAALAEALPNLSKAFKQLKEIKFDDLLGMSFDGKAVSSKMGEISSFLDAILGSPLVTAAGDKVKQLQALQDVVVKGIIPSVKAVEDMIAAAQKIEKSLEQGIKIDLDVKLKTFASKFGKVGAQGAYTVQARDVNIEVTFNVTMDARSIEPALINNSSSVIRNRLNLLMDAVQDGTTADTAKTKLASGAQVPSGGGSAPIIQ